MLKIQWFLTLGLTMLLSLPASYAQAGNPNVTMTLYQVVRESDGKQYVLAKNGKPIYVPGLNISPNASQLAVYRDGSGNFWYVDINGNAVAVTQEQLQWVVSQINTQQSSSNSSAKQSGKAGSALLTGVAAATGAAVGTAMSQPNYNGIPYAVPLYRNNNNNYYYNNGGKPVYVNKTSQNTNVVNQWNKQTNYKDMPHNNVAKNDGGLKDIGKSGGKSGGLAGRRGGDDGGKPGGLAGRRGGDDGGRSGGGLAGRRGGDDGGKSGGLAGRRGGDSGASPSAGGASGLGGRRDNSAGGPGSQRAGKSENGPAANRGASRASAPSSSSGGRGAGHAPAGGEASNGRRRGG